MTQPFDVWWGLHQNDPGVQEQLSEPRTLRARWSREIEEDLNGMYGLDVEAELSNILAEEIANEMQYQPVMIPVVRRGMPSLIAGELVGVQPMNAPTGHVFSMRYNEDSHTTNIQVQEIKKDHFDKHEDLFKI